MQALQPRRFPPNPKGRLSQTARRRPLLLPRSHPPKSLPPTGQKQTKPSQTRRCQMLTLRFLWTSRRLRMSLSQLKMSSQARVKLLKGKRAARGLLPSGLALGQSKQGVLQVTPCCNRQQSLGCFPCPFSTSFGQTAGTVQLGAWRLICL